MISGRASSALVPPAHRNASPATQMAEPNIAELNRMFQRGASRTPSTTITAQAAIIAAAIGPNTIAAAICAVAENEIEFLSKPHQHRLDHDRKTEQRRQCDEPTLRAPPSRSRAQQRYRSRKRH